MKTCTICNIEKHYEEFNKLTRSPDGYYPQCKSCKRIKDNEYYNKNKEKVKIKAIEYYNENKDQVLSKRHEKKEIINQYNKEYKQDNKEYIKEYNKEYRIKNKESIKERKKLYRKENRYEINEYERTKLKNDPLFRLSKKLRNRLYDFIKQSDKGFDPRKTEEYLGCTLEDLKLHLESKFKEDMNWNNHGKVWHIDHIIPLSLAKNEEQLYELSRWSNLQPLYVEENLKKNNKIDPTICWQKLKRDQLLEEDIKLGYPTNLKASDFILTKEEITNEHRKFIERYEWLGTCGFSVRYVFTARYNGKLGGVVMIAEPNGYQFDIKLEALIQRGACASWTPKNLGSRLVMFSCKWMVKNTTKRIFVAYSDPEAGEIGTIYQACNFDYLGQRFGSDYQYKLGNGKLVGDRYFTRTSSMKKWAKELGIKWEDSWSKSNGFQNVAAIPEDVKKLLRDYAKNLMSKCEKIPKKPKGKYVLLLTNPKERIQKTWTSEPYPKRQ